MSAPPVAAALSPLPTEGPTPDSIDPLTSRDGTRLRALFHRAVARPAKSVVAILHGYGDHGGRFARLAGDLLAAGHDVALVDYRGHGHAAGVRGHVRRFEEYLDDVDAFLHWVATKEPTEEVYLLGHSHGGLIALSYALEEGRAARALGKPLAGLVVSSPYLALAMKVSRLKLALAEVAGRLAPSLGMPSGIKPADMSHDPVVVRSYDTDPLVHKVATPGWFFAARAAQERLLAEAGRIRLPVLFLVAEDDRVVDIARTREIYSRLATPPAARELKLYPGFFHEIFNETERERPVADLVAWLGSARQRADGSAAV